MPPPIEITARVIVPTGGIVTAIHNIKANKGANTPGVDGVKIRNYLQSREDWVINDMPSWAAPVFSVCDHSQD